jgi:pimeloyl-ACP methyl ester carboxylesterase
MSYAPINGLQMYYEIHGQPAGDRVPLLLLHGGGSTIETSSATLLPLLSKERPVIAFEQQGHGRTADVDRPFSFAQSASDAVALLRYLKVPKADLFGYSNGGHIALQVALDHPEIVRKLITRRPRQSQSSSGLSSNRRAETHPSRSTTSGAHRRRAACRPVDLDGFETSYRAPP